MFGVEVHAINELDSVSGAKRIALGTAQLGLRYGVANRVGQISRLEATKIFRFARSVKIDTLDTAIAYGESETCLGELGTAGFRVLTKLPPLPESCPNVQVWVDYQLKCSLERLKLTSVGGVLLHRSADLLRPEGAALFRALQNLRESGRLSKIGVSIYSPSELEALSPKYRFDLLQAPLNLIDRRLHDSGWLRRLKDDGLEIHTRSVFLQGLLLMRQEDLPYVFHRWGSLWQRWHQWLDSHRVSALQACLALPLSIPEIDRIVVGVDGCGQLVQIVRAAECGDRSKFPDLSCEDDDLINPARWKV